MACLTVASCVSQSEPAIGISRNPDSYTLKFHIREIEGLCYAPQSFRFNGNLRLDGLTGVDTWTIVPVSPEQVEGAADILSAKRARIGRGDIELSVPRNAVFVRPAHLQFVAFPCWAPKVSRTNDAKMHIVSLSVDLPPDELGEQAILHAPGVDSNEIMPP